MDEVIFLLILYEFVDFITFVISIFSFFKTLHIYHYEEANILARKFVCTFS